ncbi:UbiX family flavin prenyltransferase [Desulfobacca acetoxidans]|uniref:Flavin prenyltransferase UbiX n=1 Tax=Desulfobacca acetoxidans (strain ATCC 700848 / DSM 11109 / ASRB2) TaxID=880072 RepID=F2NFR5_DESAR|nr:UbiX family flavin prenyltransferase [Desulfobacca acetoxidans]AEB10184.1 3-octaprenyl-4-hydroxybenzoate carboxy-lyase [Desulfobacca acetoxidans DSM 11109]HAY22621.1 UbiX family flavin prenyltransferase [Desulfobacterales bacterium]
MGNPNKPFVVGISGASGVIYGLEMLRILKKLKIESHLVITRAGRLNFQMETEYSALEAEALANRAYEDEDLTAPIASGSFLTRGMVVIPCSIKTLSAIANSYSASLLVRAADVTLKERRPLVLVVRETPLHLGHLELMQRAAAMGATILPPMPAFYHRPQTIRDLIHQTLGKVLDCFGIPHQLFHRWGEP